MDPKTIKVLSKEELYHKLGRNVEMLPVKITKDYYKELKTNLLSPSTHQIVSCCVEYMSSWFYGKFPKGFFKQTYLDMQHILPYRARTRFRDLIVTQKPAAAIRVSLDNTFNREHLDSYPYGTMTYSNKSRYKDSFFKDYDKDLYISMNMEMLKMNFSFRILVAEHGIQVDLAKRCELLFRSGFTQKHFNDVDFHIPDELLTQIAEDHGDMTCPCTGKICDTEQFLHYFNMHSSLPLYYKFEPGKGKLQYYLKIPRCYMHIRVMDIQMDEGQRNGNIQNNYSVSFDCEVRMPAPKFYAYYSMKIREQKISISPLDDKSFAVMLSLLAKVPYKNDRGWQWTMETEYIFRDEEEQKEIKDGKLMSIDFKGLLGNVEEAIELVKSMALNPGVFIEIHVYNAHKLISTTTDWWNYKIQFNESIQSEKCYLRVYMDNAYYANLLDALHEYSKHRIQTHDTPIEHKRLDDYKKNLNRTSLGKASDKVVVKEEIE